MGRRRQYPLGHLNLDELRNQVNGLNTRILDLINERTELVQEIGK